MFVHDVQRMGLTEKEAKLYFTSLRIGPSSMQILAQKAKIDRGTAYHVAMTLGEKSLFGQLAGGKRPVFGVFPPKKLYSYIEDKKTETDKQYEAVKAMLTDMEELYAAGFGEH